MMAFLHQFARWLEREQGQDLVEYGLLAAMVSLAVIAALRVAGGSIMGFWTWVAGQLAAVVSSLP